MAQYDWANNCWFSVFSQILLKMTHERAYNPKIPESKNQVTLVVQNASFPAQIKKYEQNGDKFYCFRSKIFWPP